MACFMAAASRLLPDGAALPIIRTWAQQDVMHQDNSQHHICQISILCW